jgi:type I restriction enzyme S subunit
MSSKTKTTATKEDGKPALVPKLRFPAFRDMERWGERPLGDFLTESRIPGSKGNVAKKITVKLWGNGVFEKNDAIQGSINTQYFRRKAGQFIYSKLDFLNQAFGIIPPSLDNFESTVDLPCFDFADELNTVFLLEYVKRRDFYERLGETADGSRKARRIHAETFLSFPIALPSPAEQQEIASCLSSVDELIAAQARKLDALKTHKKGLMQQLFPREGETQPRLRFPEFQNAGEWEEKRTDEWGDVLAGKALAVNAPGPLRPYLRTKNVLDGEIDISDVLTMPMTDSEFNRFEVLDGDILLNEGQSLGLVGRASTYRGEFGQRCAMQNALLRFRAFPSTCPEFAAQAFRQCQKDGTFASIATQTTSVAHLGSSRFSALGLTWPPSHAEQQRIASCLTSLDDLIAAQTQKLAALKTHKKGLMQQLFPSPEEVEV